MSYAISCIVLSNAICLPTMGILLWQMGLKNWLQWLLIIPSIGLMDIDHFIFTNVQGFGAHPAQGQKILHFAHTIEFVVIGIVIFLVYFLLIDRRQGRSLKVWFFPNSSDYTKPIHYYLAWAVRILILGVIIHWLQDLLIYSYHHKWDHLYVSLIDYFVNPS